MCIIILIIAVMVLIFGKMDETVEGLGTVFPVNYVNAAPEVSGIIQDVFVREGNKVGVDDTLFTLISDDFQFQLEKSRQLLAETQSRLTELQEEYRNLTSSESFETSVILADLFSAKKRMEIAQRDYERADRLFAKELISLEERDRAKLDYEVSQSNYRVLNERRNVLVRQYERRIIDAQRNVEMAEQAYSLAEQKLQKTVVRSPLSGTILTPKVDDLTGTKALEGQPVLQIGDLSEMTFIVRVKEGDIPKVQIGQDVKIFVNAFPHRRYKVFTGTVIELSSNPKVTESSVSFEAKVEIDEPWVEMSTSRFILRPGMSGRAKMIVRPKVRLIEIIFKGFFK